MATLFRPILLVVHDDNQLVRQLAKMTSEIAQLMISRRGSHACSMLESTPQIHAVLVGKSGDERSALDILAIARSRQPQARTMLLADSADLRDSVEALHSGLVDHVMNPPLREQELLAILKLASPRVTPAVSVEPNAVQAAKRPI